MEKVIAEGKKKKKEPFNPGPPMAAKLGMSKDWVITIWNDNQEAFEHFIARKIGKRKTYSLLELEPSECTFDDNDKPIRAASVDKLVEILEELLAPEDEDDEEDEDDDEA